MDYNKWRLPIQVAAAVNAATDLTCREPSLAVVHAVKLDKQLKQMGWTEPTTYASHGCAISQTITDSETAEDIKKYPSKFSNLHKVHCVTPSSDARSIAALLYSQVRGPEIPALNLCYANIAVGIESLWVHFFNKYLSHHGQDESINLLHGTSSKFDRLKIEEYSTREITTDGPLVSVIMPFFNSENTLYKAAKSILDQSWKNLELILVDDFSKDNSWEIASQLKAQDNRVKIISINVNSGPYVAKNIALKYAKGKYITVHDADDWAFPSRITEQMEPLLNASMTGITVTMGRTLRLKKNGQFSRFVKTSPNCLDGVNRLCFPSPLFDRLFFDHKLGAWDSVRIGADLEIYNRILRFEGAKIKILDKILMLQLDIEESITRQDEIYNDDRGESPLRLDYRKAWTTWHESLLEIPRIDFPQITRPFEAPTSIQTNPLDANNFIA